MNTIGFPIGHKEHEYRRAVLPTDLHLVKNADHLLFEQGYGEAVGFTDEDYLRAGAFGLHETVNNKARGETPLAFMRLSAPEPGPGAAMPMPARLPGS